MSDRGIIPKNNLLSLMKECSPLRKINHFLIFTLMKKIYELLSLVLAAGMLFSSCDQKEEVKYEDHPLKSVSVTIGEETAVGVVNDVEKTILFVFNDSENFSNVDLSVELNAGWTLTFPTTLTGVNLEETPALNFDDPFGQRVRYLVSFSSNAFPIVDPSKIQIEGFDAGKNLVVDNATKTITVKYDRDAMDYNNVKLIFNEGALQAGVELPEDLTFDFDDGIAQTLVLKLGGDRPYTVVLDVQAYISATPESMGFVDVTANYNLTEEQKTFVKVLKAEAISNLPVPVLKYIDGTEHRGTLYNPTWDWASYSIGYWYGSSNPRAWECVDYSWSDHNDPEHDDDIFSMPGDWVADRPTMNCFGNIYIVTFDISKVSVGMTASAGGVNITEVDGLLKTTGWNTDEAACDYLVVKDGQVVNDPDANAGEPQSAYRASLGIKDGKISFQTVARNGNVLNIVPFQTSTVDPSAVLATATEQWDVTDAAWVAGWVVRDGKSLKIADLINNDGNQWVSDTGVLGMGWGNNFYAEHNLVGTTYDGKLAFMINESGWCNWDGVEGYVDVDNAYAPFAEDWFNYRGYSLKNMFYLAQKFGWKDAAVLGNATDASAMKPVVYLNGISLTGNTNEQAARYALTVNAK